MQKVSLILACTFDGGIGYDNKIPWYISSELRKFKKITTTCKDKNKINAIIMGRNTWESLHRPLPNRLNIVITSDPYYKVEYDNVIVAQSIMAALYYAKQPYIENVFIIGGAYLYNTFLDLNFYYKMIDKIYLSILFYDPTIKVNKSISIESILTNFILYKDTNYKIESDKREFASYICIPKSQQNLR